MKIAKNNIGNFLSTRQNEVYKKAQKLKKQVDAQLQAAVQIDNDPTIDEDHKVAGRVRLDGRNPAFTLAPQIGMGGPEYTGVIQFDSDSGQPQSASLDVVDASYMNLPKYNLSFEATEDKQIYKKKDNGITDTVTIDIKSGDWEVTRKALGFIPLRP